MKKIYKIRYKYASVLLIVGMTMLSFLGFNAIKISNNMQETLTSEGYGDYKLVKNYYIDASNKNKEFLWVANAIEKIVMQNNGEGAIHCTMYVGEATQQLDVHFVMTDDYYEFANNILKDSSYSNGNTIILGSEKTANEWESLISTKLSICNEEFEVLNKVEVSELSEYDHIFIKWSDMSEGIRKVFADFTASKMCLFTMFEKGEDTTNIENIISKLQEHIYVEEMKEEKEESFTEKMYKGFNSVFYIVLMVYAIINCIVFSDIWVQNCMREFVIRKTFGMSMQDIKIHLIKEIGILSFIAVLISLPLQYLYMFITGEATQFNYEVGDLIKYILIFTVVIMYINILFPMHVIKRINPCDGLRKFGE